MRSSCHRLPQWATVDTPVDLRRNFTLGGDESIEIGTYGNHEGAGRICNPQGISEVIKAWAQKKRHRATKLKTAPGPASGWAEEP
jgi:hypothetical protein